MRLPILVLVATVAAVAADTRVITFGGLMGNGLYGNTVRFSNMYGGGMFPGGSGLTFTPMSTIKIVPSSSVTPTPPAATQPAGTTTSTVTVNGQRMRCVCTPVNDQGTSSNYQQQNANIVVPSGFGPGAFVAPFRFGF